MKTLLTFALAALFFAAPSGASTFRVILGLVIFGLIGYNRYKEGK
jgi:hypothetical protein